jgi:hypothetical protein
VAGKRQHYVPRFLLQRFTANPADRKSFLVRLDKGTGQCRKANPTNEAVVGHYYRLVLDDGTVVNDADAVLTEIENLGAQAIERLAAGTFDPAGDDVQHLLLFVLTLKNRTPRAREGLRRADEQVGELRLEMELSDPANIEWLREAGESDEDLEARRLRYLDDLRNGGLIVVSDERREIALMFTALEQTMSTLLKEIGFVCIRIPPESTRSFVISDHPVAHYDPAPKMRDSGAGFTSSPQSVTFVALDPKFGLLLTPSNPRKWSESVPTDEEVDELNLLTYGWAKDAIFGSSQHSVTEVRRYAKRHPKLMGEFRYRPPQLWITNEDGAGGIKKFTSRHHGETKQGVAYVQPSPADRARRTK